MFAYRMLCGEEIVVWGDGSVVRDYLHVHDLAHLCRLALASIISGVFNAGSGIGRSLREVIAALEVAFGERATVRYEAGRAFDVPRIVLDSSDAHNAFGWQPAIGFEHGLVEVREWLLNEWEPGHANVEHMVVHGTGRRRRRRNVYASRSSLRSIRQV